MKKRKCVILRPKILKMTYFLFYFILYPLSILPLCLLYLICFPFYLIMAYIIRYRRKIIDDNFAKSFPEWSKWQVWKARQRYYIHFAQLAAEMLTNSVKSFVVIGIVVIVYLHRRSGHIVVLLFLVLLWILQETK